jgi:hypothetical protein
MNSSKIQLSKEKVLTLLKLLDGVESYIHEGITYKILPFEKIKQLNYCLDRMPIIYTTDAMIKKKNLPQNSIVAIYRDYEFDVDPYYYLRRVAHSEKDLLEIEEQEIKENQ